MHNLVAYFTIFNAQVNSKYYIIVTIIVIHPGRTTRSTKKTPSKLTDKTPGSF